MADDAPLLNTARTSPDDGGASTEAAEGTSSDLGQPAPRPGDAIGRYHVLHRIGAGSSGIVYAAFDPELDRKVALKLLQPERAHTEVARERLVREARAMARVTHPNVVTVHDAGTHRGDVFIAMECVEGATLRKWLRAERPSWQKILEVFRLAGHGLEAAHELDLIHRDFKPDNVMVGVDGAVRVMDFGLVFRAGDSDLGSGDVDSHDGDAKLTKTGALLGTPLYMSPEQHERRELGPQSDQFSFCLALYQALWRQLPYPNDTMPAYAAAALAGKIRPPPASPVPLRIKKAILRGLSAAPSDRWPSMSVLLDALVVTPRRRYAAAVGVGAIAALALGALAANRIGGPPDPCLEGATRAENVWNPERRAEALRVINSGDPNFAVRVTQRLDDFATGWVTAYEEACRATRVQGVQSEAVLHLRMACLSRELAELDATATVITEPGIGAAELTALANSSLADLDTCAHPHRIASALPQPEDPAVRDELERARRQLDVVRALQLAGKYDQAQQVLDAALPSVQRLGRDDAFAHAAFARGALLAAQDDREGAVAALEDAAWTAMKIGDQRTALRAASELITVLGRDQLDIRRGREWISRAESLTQQLAEDANAVLGVRLNAADFLNRIGDYEEAETYYEGVRASLATKMPGAEPLMARTLYGLGRLAYYREEFAAAEEMFLRSQELYRSAYGPLHPEVGWIHSALGAVARRDDRLDDAVAHQEQAVDLLKEAVGRDGRRVAGAMSNLGAAYVAAGRSDDAERTLTEAVELLERDSDYATLLFALSNVADLRVDQGRRDEAADAYARAIEAGARHLPPEHPEIGSVRASKGRNDLLRGEVELAIKELEQAVASIAKKPSPSSMGYAKFWLARALAQQDPERHRVRIKELAAAARQAVASVGAQTVFAREFAECEATARCAAEALGEQRPRPTPRAPQPR